MVTRTRFPPPDQDRDPEARAPGDTSRKRPEEPWSALKKAWRAIGKRIPEMREDLSCYSAVQIDRARLLVTQMVTRVVASILLIVAVGAVFATAVSLAIIGIAGGVAAALDGNVWLANVITGIGVLVLLFLVIAINGGAQKSKRMRHLVRRYERYEARQRSMPQTSMPQTSMPQTSMPQTDGSEAGKHVDRS